MSITESALVRRPPIRGGAPEEVLAFYLEHGYTLERMTTVDGRHGCNEYVFRSPLAGR